MKEIIINVDAYNENSIKTIEGDNLSEVYKIYICKNKRRIDLTNKIAIMAYVNEYGNKKSNILALNITNASQGEIELPITNVISSENGVYACQVAIYGENNSLEQTAPFSLIVENNIFSKISNTAINSTDFHILSEAIKTTSEYAEKLKQGTENIELQYANKTDQLQKQIDSLTLGAVGDGNNAEVVQARAGYTVLNDRLNSYDYTSKGYDYIIDNSVLNWSNGLINGYGDNQDDATKIRINKFFTKSFADIIQANKGYEFILRAWNNEHNAIITTQDKWLTYLNLKELNDNYEYKLFVRKTEGGNISIDESVNIKFIIESYVKKIDDKLTSEIKNVDDFNRNLEEKMTKEFLEINNDIYYKETKDITNLKWESGVQLVDGTFDNNPSYSHTDINVTGGEVYYITGYNFYKNVLFAVLDEKGTVLTQVQERGQGEAILYNNIKVEIPENGTILRVNKREPVEGTLFLPKIKKEIKSTILDKKTTEIKKEIFTKTNSLVDMNNLKSDKAIMSWVTTANIKNESTYLYSNKGRKYTDLYEVYAGDIYKSAFEKASQKGFVYMLFNKNGNFLKATNNLVTEVVVEEDGYIIFDFPNKDLIPEAIVKVKNNKDFPFVEPFYHENFSCVPYKEVEKPLDIIDKTGGYMAIFHDFGVIGDSLASGNMEGVDSSGNYIYKDNLDYSWGKCIARATGCTNHQFSRGGQYLHDNNWFDEWKERVKATPCTAYIICIGFNDYNWLKEDPSRLGSISDIKSNYLENPNSFYGQYGKMIQLLKEVQPKAKLFLCNMEWNNTDDSQINKAIGDMVNHFDNAYLIDLYTYAHEPYWGVPNVYKTGLYHKNTLGYQKMAWNIMSYIDYIVRHNMEDFIYVQFIGTEYRLPTKEEIESEQNK